MKSLSKLLTDSKVLICVGSGGVGKTTTASALAFWAAEQGRKVLVLTIDPSRRLKTTMGLEGSDEVTRIEHNKIKGELWASVINNKKTFDQFVLRASKDSQAASRLLNNKLYQQLSTTLSGSQEFTALEKLYSSVESGKYDLVVLDTPPTKHAIDFLEAPQKLSTLFQDSVAKWFRESDRKESLFLRLMSSGTQQVMRALERLTGSEFMKSLAEFFQTIQGWQSRLESRISDVHRLMVDPQTQFLLVTSLDVAKIQETVYFTREIEKGGYHLAGVLINRAYPFWLKKSTGVSDQESRMRSYYQERLKIAEKVESEARTYGRFVVKTPELRENISDLESVVQMAEVLKSSEE